MSRLGRGLLALVGAPATYLAVVVGPAYAGGGLQQCLDQAIDHNGEPPTCTKVNGTWVASWPDDTTSSSMGFGGGFALLVVIGIVVGIAITVWRVTTARRLATESGMSPGLATQMTLLTENGLDATYLAANLRPQQPAAPTAAPADPGPATRPVAERLAELKALRDQGLITQEEYDERRTSIIDAV